ncbi:MAG: DUF4350 domain-containing protein [Armatimonadetes bacterium]|nr:DUF4350 domain-containing protein [Armatimonadota bacterium]MDW8029797.1 DUF4350 domain-containing protein [Armatimonadota bacterium]
MKHRQILLVSVFLVSIVALTILTVRQQEESLYRNLPLIRTSYSTRPQGTKALYRTLDELGFKVERWRKAWRYLDIKKKNCILFVIEPFTPAFPGLEDWQQLVKFAKAGNLVWISAEMEETVAGSKKGQRVTRSGGGTSIYLSASLIPSRPARILFPAAWFKGVRGYIVKSETRLTKPWHPPIKATFSALEPTREIPLLGDKLGIVMKVIVAGKGYIVVDSNPYALSNEGISKGDHFRLVINVVSSISGQSGEILFDEWGRGLGEGEHWWWAVTPATRNAILQLAIASCLLLLAISTRFGRPVIFTSRTFVRTPFVQGLATLLKRGNTLRDVIKMIELHFLRQVFGMHFLWQLPENDKFDQILLSSPIENQEQVRQIWLWAEKLRKKSYLNEREILNWSRIMQDVIKKKDKKIL